MSGLEVQYRRLMRAYPPDYRARHEDEMVSTLLDVADDGQQRPRLREATAIVTAGLGCRVQSGSELEPGLRLAGVVALAATLAVSTTAIVLAARQPFEIGLIPMVAWFAVVMAAAVCTWATSTYRVIPAATLTPLMVAAGSSGMGLRRSTLVPAAVLLILSALSRPARRSVRLSAAGVGIVMGSLLGIHVASNMNRVFEKSDSPWVYAARWDIASDLMPSSSPLFFLLCILTAIAATLWWRLRYAIAASILAIPFVPAILFGRGGMMVHLTRSIDVIFLSVLAAILALGTTVHMSWRGIRQERHPDRSA